MLRSVIYTLLLAGSLSLGAACGKADNPTPTATVPGGQDATATSSHTATQPPKEPTPLEIALSRVPLQYVGARLAFADYGAANSLIGADPTGLTSLAELNELNKIYEEKEGRPTPYRGTEFFAGHRYRVFMTRHEHLGLKEALHTGMVSGTGIWTSASPGSESPPILSVDIAFPKDPMIKGLLELGYEEIEYEGVTYYALNEDYEIVKSLATTYINRMAFVGERLLAAPATEVIMSLIDAEQGRDSSLMNSEAYKAIGSAVGQELLSARIEPYSAVNSELEAGSIDGYNGGVILSRPDRWESLSVYELLLTGYRIRDGEDETVLAFYYPDPDAAEMDAGNLEHRWETYVFPDAPASIPELGVGEGFKLSQACGPLSTEVIQGDGFSVLVASCQLLWDPDGKFVQRGDLWQRIVPSIPIYFQDMDNFREAVASGQE